MLCVSIVSKYQVINKLLDCGDITDVAANDGVFGAESECATPCPGDPIYLCGDGNRLNTYFWNGTMNNWQTPENTGFYEVSSIFMTYLLLAHANFSSSLVSSSTFAKRTRLAVWSIQSLSSSWVRDDFFFRPTNCTISL